MTKITLILVMLVSQISLSQVNDSVGSQPVKEIRSNSDRAKFLITAGAGPSFRIGAAPQGLTYDQNQYVKDLKSGFSYNASAYYLTNTFFGFGLKFNLYNSSGTLDNQELTAPNGDTGTGTTSDNITIIFFGPAVVFHWEGLSTRDDFSAEVGLGYIGYKDVAFVLAPYTIKGSTIGVSGAVQYSFGITENNKIGPALSITGGTLQKFKITGPNYSSTLNLDEEMQESLS